MQMGCQNQEFKSNQRSIPFGKIISHYISGSYNKMKFFLLGMGIIGAGSPGKKKLPIL